MRDIFGLFRRTTVLAMLAAPLSGPLAYVWTWLRMKHARPPLSLVDSLQIYAISLVVLLVLWATTLAVARWLKLPFNAPYFLMVTLVVTAVTAVLGLAALDVFAPHDVMAPKTVADFLAGVIHAVMAGGVLALTFAVLSGARWRLTDDT